MTYQKLRKPSPNVAKTKIDQNPKAPKIKPTGEENKRKSKRKKIIEIREAIPKDKIAKTISVKVTLISDIY